MGEVEVFWFRDNRRGKGGGALEITEETKEKTFICSLENSVSSENSTELHNPLLTDGNSAAGGDAAPPEETTPFLSENEKCNPESSVTVTAEINSQNDPNTTNTQEPDQNPDPALSLETKPDPETNTTNRPEPDESPDPAPSSETRPDPEETRPNQESRVTVTAEINHQNESNPQEPDLEPATTPSIGTTQEPNTKTDEDPENLNKDPSEEVNHETGSGSAENDPPETERAEASSGSPDGGVSTSESSCEQ
ncbi:hypothetical protein FQA47_010716 [Oryzias melastigma]|uniref:Uncharacterized protein n=1 Tax=Oryzias melastigma TaxID=30732 RepID=A0A834CH78_ORYME|nr:hypothetical protein FQA47_010716 [Oryzias melastigma]